MAQKLYTALCIKLESILLDAIIDLNQNRRASYLVNRDWILGTLNTNEKLVPHFRKGQQVMSDGVITNYVEFFSKFEVPRIVFCWLIFRTPCEVNITLRKLDYLPNFRIGNLWVALHYQTSVHRLACQSNCCDHLIPSQHYFHHL